MQYLFISIFVLSNLLNFSTQMGTVKGEFGESSIRKKASSGIAIASVEFFLEETEDNNEQEEHDSPEIQGGTFRERLAYFTSSAAKILSSGYNGGICPLFVRSKIYLFLHNMRI